MNAVWWPAMDEPALPALIEAAQRSRRTIALTGAGLSTDSGIPDYRGPGGVWERTAVPTLGDFVASDETRRDYWRSRQERYPKLVAAEPNAGHLALARLGHAGRLQAIITQNIDGLHQKAGSDPDSVIELHGTAHRVKCLNCGNVLDAAIVQHRQAAGETVPVCRLCDGPMRAATVLFGESLPAEALQRAVAVAASCDLMIVVGTSLVVRPASQLPGLARSRGAQTAIINRTPTPLDHAVDFLIRAEAGPVLEALATALGHAHTPGPSSMEESPGLAAATESANEARLTAT